MHRDELLISLGFEKRADVREPIVTALRIEDSLGRNVVIVELTEHEIVHLLSGSVVTTEGRVTD